MLLPLSSAAFSPSKFNPGYETAAAENYQRALWLSSEAVNNNKLKPHLF